MNEYLDERLEPSPEQPVQLRDDEERDEEWTEERAHGAGDQTEGDHGHRDGFRKGDEQQDDPVDEVGQNRPRVRLHEPV